MLKRDDFVSHKEYNNYVGRVEHIDNDKAYVTWFSANKNPCPFSLYVSMDKLEKVKTINIDNDIKLLDLIKGK